jgi:hypothetical protein
LSVVAVARRFRANLVQTRLWRRKPTIAETGTSLFQRDLTATLFMVKQ